MVVLLLAGRSGHAIDVQRVQQRRCEVQLDYSYKATVVQ